MHRLTSHTIDSEAALRELLGEPNAVVCAKFSDRLNPLTRQFIERSPFVCLATSDALGNCDVSPRGDPAGFVRILDDRTLLLPERPGNRIADSLRNTLSNPHVGLLFVVPGSCVRAVVTSSTPSGTTRSARSATHDARDFTEAAQDREPS